MLNHRCEIDRVIASRVSFLPRNISLEIALSEDFVANLPKVLRFSIIYRNKNRTII